MLIVYGALGAIRRSHCSRQEDRVYDADGNGYIDCLSGAAVNVLEYGASLEKIYSEQARTTQHTCFPYSPNIPAITLAERLIEITPGSTNKRIIFLI